MRYDEDYSFLKDSAATPYRRLKYLPLFRKQTGNLSSVKSDNLSGAKSGPCSAATSWLSFGGEARIEYDAFDNEDWGALHAGHDNFWLQRYQLHADWRLSRRIRLFAELRSAYENGRPHGPRPIDEDKGNVQNLFADFHLTDTQKDSLFLRVGRQEINYGSGRWLSAREGPNLRQYFTGIKTSYTHFNLSVDVFAFEADSIYTKAFDNRGTKEINLWGFYASWQHPNSTSIDWYFLGSRKDNAPFAGGTKNSIRQTAGARLWYKGNGFNYDIEAALQFGRFGNEPIHAWSASADIGYLFGDLKWTPLIGLRNDYLSGDKKPGDGKLESFDPLYPKAGYFAGFDPQAGAVNLITLHPYAVAAILPHCSLSFDWIFDWRFSTGDGIYRPNGVLNRPGSQSDKTFIGMARLLKIAWDINPFLNINFGAQLFDTGPFIDSIIPGAKNAVLTNSQILFKF